MISNSRTTKIVGKHLLWGGGCIALAGALLFAPVAAQGQSLQFQPVITTYAGGATTVCTAATDIFGDGCPATQAILASPHIGDSDATGNFYFPDTTNNIIRRVDAVTGIITLFAGSSTGTAGYSGDGGQATAAKLNQPKGLRIDPFGNVVVADLNNNRIRSINPTTGIITTIAGSATQGSGINTNGTVANALKFQSPFDLAFDKSGNLYISDYYDNEVVLVTVVNGAIVPTSSLGYVLAGTGTAGRTGDNGPAPSAEVDEPRGITVDASGNVYIADFANSYVRKITSPFQNGTLNLTSAIISSYAGNGTNGYLPAQDGGAPTSAEVAAPQGVTTDAAGNLYIAQYGAGFDVIRKINSTVLAAPTISTFAGTGVAGYAGDGGAAIAAKLYSPAGLSVDRNGRFLIHDATNNRIRLVQPVTIFATTAVGSSSAASNVVAQATAAVTPKTVGVTANSHDFTTGTMTGCTLNTAAAIGAECSVPVMFTPAAPGVRKTAVMITDSSANNYVTGVIGIGSAPAVAYTPSAIATLTGTGVAGNTGNNGPASLAQVNAPRGSVIDASGSLVFADSGSNVIRRIDHTTGAISVLAGTGTSGYAGDAGAATAAKLNAPADVVLDAAGNLYIADTGNNVIREVNAATGIITTVAGTGTAGYTGDLGLATTATLNMPTGLAMDFAGRLYVVDTGNEVIRRFVPNGGYIATIAGTGGTAGYSGDGAAATLAVLNTPVAVTVDPAGDIYIADRGNYVIRKITPLGIISTYAGMRSLSSNSGDGGAATSAGLLTPSDVALDAAGDLYIAAGGVVRFVNAAGVISTIAGNGLTGVYSGEGGAATSATIPSPAVNLAVDGAANVYLSDTTGNIILTISDATARTLNFGTQAPLTTSASQTVAVLNTGNLPLVLSGLSVSANYQLQSTAASACTSTSTIAAGASCTLTVAFSPATTGTITGSVVLTDNALNGTAVTQTIPLTGISAVPANPTTTTLTTTPTTLTYGSSIIFNATVTGTATLTGSVVFAVDGTTVGTVPVSSGNASLTLTRLVAGKRTITATYTNDVVNSTSSATATVMVAPAVLTVTAINVSQNAGVAIPAFAYTITGFQYSETSSVISGTATFTTTATTASAAGTYPITETASTLSAANYSFTYISGTLTLTPPDFTLTASPTSITIPAGQTANVTVTLTPLGAYKGTVTLSCGTLPVDDTCSFATSTLTADGSGTVLQTLLVIATDNFNHVADATPACRPG